VSLAIARNDLSGSADDEGRIVDAFRSALRIAIGDGDPGRCGDGGNGLCGSAIARLRKLLNRRSDVVAAEEELGQQQQVGALAGGLGREPLHKRQVRRHICGRADCLAESDFHGKAPARRS
jgi:hypothetical protein